MYISRNLEQWNAFLATLQTAFKQGKAQDFLTLLLTPDERDAVGLRLQIVAQLLDKNLSQREIQQNLNTSAATITRGSNMLKTMDPDFINWVKSQLDEQAAKTKRILTALLHLFRPSWWKKLATGCVAFFSRNPGIFHLLPLYPCSLLCLYGTAKIGHLLQLDFSYSIKYDWVSLDEISPNMQLAVIAAEDQKFPNHWGFDFEAIQKAFKFNEKSRRIRGASTISQQTAKNLVLWHGQSWFRKGLEVPITALMEIFWSKERILEVYLNIAEFGHGIFGVEAASRYYFKKSAKNLTQSEAALLAAVLPNPIIYKVNKPSALVRKNKVGLWDK